MAAKRACRSCCGVLFVVITICQQIICEELEACTHNDFRQMTLPCTHIERRRTVVYYMYNKCDLKKNGSITYPPLIKNLPCKCDPGQGEVTKSDGNIVCEKCKPGQFSYGGELLDNWKNWNASTTHQPGFQYKVYPYCCDFLTGKMCQSWRPGGDGSYLISGDFKNSTLLRCFEQSILVISRHFVRKDGDNQISFQYKVDGSACRRGSTTCSHGLSFYVDDVKQFKKDLQFRWTDFSANLTSGKHLFKFVYHRSCTQDAVLDVAYIKHISMIGTDSPNTHCANCTAGTFSKSIGSAECVKCLPNYYQPQTGQTECKKCPKNYFSRIGEEKCTKLPDCTQNDFAMLPLGMAFCIKVGKAHWMVKQSVYIPKWPGFNASCIQNKNVTRALQSSVRCTCQPGNFLQVKDGKVHCKKCPIGTYSDGLLFNCSSCPLGSAAIPGYFINHFSADGIPKSLKQQCSGEFCMKNLWQPRGEYMATARLPGSFEAILELKDIEIEYHDARIEFNCSVDCRMTLDGKQLAKHDHCFLKFLILKNNASIREVDCVNRYHSKLRNGSIQKHVYKLKEAGAYTFKSLFHHEDEANYSLVSYEARIYFINIIGAKHGSAKSCMICPPGTKQSANQALCVKCPNGTYSTNSSKSCTRCKLGTFADKEGSAKCIPCGSGTTSNEQRDGCDYNGCKYSPQPGVTYDLSPLSNDGGPMHRVMTFKHSRRRFPLIYYVNICTLRHDNTSCTTNIRQLDKKTRRLKVVKTKILRTMACKRWAFDTFYSYSIGEILNFSPLKSNVTQGLMINLTGGYRCWNKAKHVYVVPSTSILMECDLTAGIGVPAPRSDTSVIDELYCHFQLRWRTTYACPLCAPSNYKNVYSKCINGSQYVSRTRISACHSPSGISDDKPFNVLKCSMVTTKGETKSNGTPTALVALIVIAVALIAVLIVFVAYYARRNRYLRGKLILGGTSFAQVLEDDEDGLVDHMQT